MTANGQDNYSNSSRSIPTSRTSVKKWSFLSSYWKQQDVAPTRSASLASARLLNDIPRHAVITTNCHLLLDDGQVDIYNSYTNQDWEDVTRVATIDDALNSLYDMENTNFLLKGYEKREVKVNIDHDPSQLNDATLDHVGSLHYCDDLDIIPKKLDDVRESQRLWSELYTSESSTSMNTDLEQAWIRLDQISKEISQKSLQATAYYVATPTFAVLPTLPKEMEHTDNQNSRSLSTTLQLADGFDADDDFGDFQSAPALLAVSQNSCVSQPVIETDVCVQKYEAEHDDGNNNPDELQSAAVVSSLNVNLTEHGEYSSSMWASASVKDANQQKKKPLTPTSSIINQRGVTEAGIICLSENIAASSANNAFTTPRTSSSTSSMSECADNNDAFFNARRSDTCSPETPTTAAFVDARTGEDSVWMQQQNQSSLEPLPAVFNSASVMKLATKPVETLLVDDDSESLNVADKSFSSTSSLETEKIPNQSTIAQHKRFEEKKHDEASVLEDLKSNDIESFKAEGIGENNFSFSKNDSTDITNVVSTDAHPASLTSSNNFLISSPPYCTENILEAPSVRQSLEDTIPSNVPCSIRFDGMDTIDNVVAGGESCSNVPISLFLPITDLSSPYAKFTRRKQQRYFNYISDGTESFTSSSSFSDTPGLDSLPSYYFESTQLDDTILVLESLPWNYLQSIYGNSQSDCFELNMWDDVMTIRLCELDTALEAVNSVLLKGVQPHELDLVRANLLTYDLDKNLRMAFMYLERSKKALLQANGLEGEGDGLAGACALLQLWQQRDDYRDLNKILEHIHNIIEKENALYGGIGILAINDIVNASTAVSQLSNDLEISLCQGPLSMLSCLDNARSRLVATNLLLWKRLLKLLSEQVVQCCSMTTFDWIQYGALVDVALDLHMNSSRLECNNFGKNWCDKVMEALCHEVDRAFAVALLDPTQAVDSEYEKELFHLAYEMKRNWGDSAKLRALTHNLVTLRFQIEATGNYLPHVFNKLCFRLTEILHVHMQFFRWHDDKSEVYSKHLSTDNIRKIGLLKSTCTAIGNSRVLLWDRCESVFKHCFNEFNDFAANINFFNHVEEKFDESIWLEDLVSLNDVVVLLDRFLCMKAAYFGDIMISTSLLSLKKNDSQSSTLYDKLCDVLRRHLQALHVEAMNGMGRLLAKDSWILTPIATESESEEAEESCSNKARIQLLNAIRSEFLRFPRPKNAYRRTYDEENWFSLTFVKNPFFDTVTDGYVEAVDTNTGSECVELDPDSKSKPQFQIFSLLHDAVGLTTHLLSTESISRGLVVWLARLLATCEHLPLIFAEISTVFSNLFDLYFTTVFRLCAGCVKNERILLGIDRPSLSILSREEQYKVQLMRPAGSPLFGSFRRKGAFVKSRASTKSLPSFPSTFNAEICAPLLKDEADVNLAKAFIIRAQSRLHEVVNLEKVGSWLVDQPLTNENSDDYIIGKAQSLEKREAAVWSCFVVAALADVAFSEIERNLQTSFSVDSHAKNADSLKSYVRTILEMTPALAAIASQYSCIQAIDGADVVRRIVFVNSSWEECILKEQSNDYVDVLVDRCALLWGFFSTSSRLPFTVKSSFWERIVAGAYLSMLEGFAKIPSCSTEGRALMTLDLASFSAGIAPLSVATKLDQRSVQARPPPTISSALEMSQRLANYIKAHYLPENDLMSWIFENYKTYQMRHLFVLLSISLKDAEQVPENVQKRIDCVKELYDESVKTPTKSS